MRVARPGVTEQDMIEEFERYVVSRGAKVMFTQIAFGPRGGQGYVMKRDAVLHEGEVIRFDVGCMLDGYNTDIARNFSIGEPDERCIRYFDATIAGIDAAAAAMQPGATAADVFHAAVGAVREHGIPQFARTTSGTPSGSRCTTCRCCPRSTPRPSSRAWSSRSRRRITSSAGPASSPKTRSSPPPPAARTSAALVANLKSYVPNS